MPINVSGALDLDKCELVTVEQTAIGSFVDGLYTKGAPTHTDVLCSVQQPTAKELQILPQGERDKDMLKFILNFNVSTTRDGSQLIADFIIRNGKRYKIIKSEDWNIFGHSTVYGALVE